MLALADLREPHNGQHSHQVLVELSTVQVMADACHTLNMPQGRRRMRLPENEPHINAAYTCILKRAGLQQRKHDDAEGSVPAGSSDEHTIFQNLTLPESNAQPYLPTHLLPD